MTLSWLMNSNMIKPEKFHHLHLVYDFTVPLTFSRNNFFFNWKLNIPSFIFLIWTEQFWIWFSQKFTKSVEISIVFKSFPCFIPVWFSYLGSDLSIANIKHVYMRPDVNPNRFEISNRFEMSFCLHDNLHGDFTALTF